MERIINHYNPEHDVPSDGQPEITWADNDLAEAVMELFTRVEKIEAALKESSEVLKRAATLAAGESLI